jgi:hypothetical protein
MVRFRTLTIGFLVLALGLAPVAALGSEEGHGASGEVGHARDHKNEVALFLGLTDEEGHDSELTWAFDYKRRVAEKWAVGGAVDYAGGELRNTVLLALAFFWPGLGNLQFLGGPGVEFHSGRGLVRDDHDGVKLDKDATYFVFRVGVAYDFHLGNRFGLVPNVNLDLVDGEKVWVYGLALSYGW